MRVFASIALAGALVSGTAMAVPGSFTDFEGFTTGASVDGQGGWSATGPFDESVVDDGGNTVWRISNAVTAGSFGDQPFAPRPGGIVADSTVDPVNGNPNSFAGESLTGATHNRAVLGFDFRSATGAGQAGLAVTFSADNGSGGRQGFISIRDSGAGGLDVVTFDVDSSGGFPGFPGAPNVLATGLSYDEFHSFSMEILFNDGPDNDVINYFIDGLLVHTAGSWEQFYINHQPALHPFGVPVQTGIFRVSGTAEPNNSGNGLFIDNVLVDLSSQSVPEPGAIVLFGIGLIGLGVLRRRRKLT